MPSVTIWTLESDHDAKAVECLAKKLIAHLQLEDITIRAVGLKTVPKRLKGQPDTAAALKKAVELYLQQDDCLIFVIRHYTDLIFSLRRGEAFSLGMTLEKCHT